MVGSYISKLYHKTIKTAFDELQVLKAV